MKKLDIDLGNRANTPAEVKMRLARILVRDWSPARTQLQSEIATGNLKDATIVNALIAHICGGSGQTGQVESTAVQAK